MSLDSKLQELKKAICVMQKDGQGHGYKYVSEESILLLLNEKMIELGLKLTPSFISNTLQSEVVNYTNAKGQPKTDVLVRSEMNFTWKDLETGETEVIPWVMIGQQADASQSLGSGLTYTNRYFLLKYFNIATSNDDPDKLRSEMEAAIERNKLSASQTKIKKLFEEAIQKLKESLRQFSRKYAGIKEGADLEEEAYFNSHKVAQMQAYEAGFKAALITLGGFIDETDKNL